MQSLIVRQIQTLQDYTPVWQQMREFTDNRESDTPDEIWLMEHRPVFTQGQAGKAEHILNPHDIPIVQSDRGGQVTYHGPGQLMIYTLINIKAIGLNTRDFVRKLEQCIIEYLAMLEIPAENKVDAPGVYVNNAKICSIGLRVRKGSSYHGLAFNIRMDLTPFSYINPCGFKQLQMAQLTDFKDVTIESVIDGLLPTLIKNFGYNQWQLIQSNQLEPASHD